MRSPDDPSDIDINIYQQEFSSRIDSSILKKHVNYAGVVSGEKKKRYLREADIFVLPTQYHVEGQPISIIEAMAYSCAIITTKYRSIPDILNEGNNPIYIKYSDSVSIADALEYLIKNKKILKAYKRDSRQIYETRFKWKFHYEKMKNILLS